MHIKTEHFEKIKRSAFKKKFARNELDVIKFAKKVFYAELKKKYLTLDSGH